MPEPLNSSRVVTRHDASDDGNSSRTASTYAGMMPLKPRPNTAETVKSPASLWVARKPTIATSWQTEPAKIIGKPPIRSATRPQICRLTKSATEQHQEHRRADWRRNPDIGAQSHKMALRHRHWHAT